jgi:hypothetical protein
MKKLLYFFPFLISVSAFSQKDFEGTIKYRVITPTYYNDNGDNAGLKKDSINLEISFTKGMISVRPEDKGVIIIIPDSAKVYELDKESKTYSIKKLRIRETGNQLSKETILGYAASPLSSAGSIMSPFGSDGNFWFADSLFFHIPRTLEGNEDLIMINNNRILLKAIIGINGNSQEAYREDDTDSLQIKEVAPWLVIIAVEIMQGNIDPADFIIPDDYTKEEHAEYWMDTTRVGLSDTIVEIVDSVAVKPSVQPEKTHKVPAKQPSKTTTNKAPAHKKEP